MGIDKMDWHCGSDDFHEDMPEENGATHIGMFLTWVVKNDLLGEYHTVSSGSMKYVAKIKNRELTGRDLLVDFCDGKFIESDLSDVGRQFARDYYTDKSKFTNQYSDYFSDYIDAVCDIENIYDTTNSWENYDIIEKILDERFCQWNEQPDNWKEDISIWDKIWSFIKK